MNRRHALWVGSLVFVLSGCATTRTAPPPAAEAAPPPPPARTGVSGSVSYLERMALTPEAVVHVEVVRQGPAEGASRVVGEQTLRTPGQVPIDFTLTLTEPLDPEADYVLRASITDGARQLSSGEAVPVLTRGHPSEGVRVRVSGSAGRAPPR